jgi:hypothetical protein
MIELLKLRNYLNSNEFDKCKEIICNISRNNLKPQQERGLTSLIMRYYLGINDISKMYNIIDSGEQLMKRDYLLFCTNVYKNDIVKSLYVFKNFVLSKELLQSKDIDMLIDNNCYYLLRELDGYYITCCKKTDEELYNLKKYNLGTIKHNIILYYKDKIHLSFFRTFIDALTDVDVLLDGGNISYYGDRGNCNYTFIVKILENALEKYKKPLLVIHPRHLKSKNKNIELLKTKYSKYIYSTSYKIYDDYFLLLGMIYNNIPVVTNDNFRDHIYEMFELFDTKNNKIKNYISEMKLSFSDKYIEDKIGYSKCIQVINNSIYIPTETGYYRMSY